MRILARQQTDRARQMSSTGPETLGKQNVGSPGADYAMPHSISVGQGMSSLLQPGVTADLDMMRMEGGDANAGRKGAWDNRGKLSGGGSAVVSGLGLLGKSADAEEQSVCTTNGMTGRNSSMYSSSQFPARANWARPRPGERRTDVGTKSTTVSGVEWIPLSNGAGVIGTGGVGVRAWGRGWSGGGKLPRRASEGVSLAYMNTDRWAGGERSFKVLGVEIGHLTESQQFVVCAGGVFAFLLVYGYMQVTTTTRETNSTCYSLYFTT